MTKNNISERMLDLTKIDMFFSVQWQGTSARKAVFNLYLNTVSDGDNEMKGGKLFRYMTCAVTDC